MQKYSAEEVHATRIPSLSAANTMCVNQHIHFRL